MNRHPIFCAILLTVSCSITPEPAEPGRQDGLEKVVFTASQGDPDLSRTILLENGKSLWEAYETIKVWDGTAERSFTSTNDNPAPVVEFEGEMTPDAEKVVALYGNAAFDENGNWTFDVEPTQYYPLQCSSFPLAAQADNNHLKFRYLCGGIKLRLATEGVTDVIFRGNRAETVAQYGVKGAFDANGKPCEGAPVGVDEFTLDYSTVGMNSYYGFETGKWYYLAVLPVELEKGFTIIYKKNNGEEARISSDKPYTIRRGEMGVLDCMDTAPETQFESKALLGWGFFPDNVGRETITGIHFHTNSAKTTDTVVSDQEGYKPVYLELEGTEAHYYTQATKYEIWDASSMFWGFSALKSLDLTSFDTENVSDFRSMFAGCNSLESVDLSSFYTGNALYMSEMFRECYSIKDVDLSNFITANVTGMDMMFSECYALESVNLSSFDTRKVTYMNAMFRNDESLQAIDLSNFRTPCVQSVSSMFSQCTKLAWVDISNMELSPDGCSCWDVFSYVGDEDNHCTVICPAETRTVIEAGRYEPYDHIDWQLPE